VAIVCQSSDSLRAKARIAALSSMTVDERGRDEGAGTSMFLKNITNPFLGVAPVFYFACCRTIGTLHSLPSGSRIQR
jgi:hypothetical protein